MKKIACYSEEYTKKYTDKEGNEKYITYEQNDWQLGTILDNGTKEGMKQRVRSAELLLAGEVAGKENEVGINWDYYFENINAFYSDNETLKKNIRNSLSSDLKKALTPIGNLKEVLEVIYNENNTDKKRIQLVVIFTYIDVFGNEAEGDYVITK